MGKGSLLTLGNRIEILDILRGFALAGILYAHMVFWYTGAALPPAVYYQYEGILSLLAMAIFGAFVFGKFFSVFSFLFGLGFYLHFRSGSKKGSSKILYTWRMFLLLLIGLIHHSIWRGDILAMYAVLGVLLLFFRRLPDKLLLLTSLLLIINLPGHILEVFTSHPSTAKIDFPMAAEARSYYSLVKNGDFVNVLVENTGSWPAKIQYQLESGRLLMTLGYFLLGFYAGRKQLFEHMEEYTHRFKKWNKTSGKLVLGLLFTGLLLYLLGYVTLPQLNVAPQLQWITGFLFSIYNAGLTIFYITGISLLFQNKTFEKYLKPLGAMGRMALTNYLLQTFFGLLIFYSFGFGLFDSTSPAQNVLLAVLVFYLQLKFSQLWLTHFKQGPVEWLWKGLSYFQFYTNKNRPTQKKNKDLLYPQNYQR